MSNKFKISSKFHPEGDPVKRTGSGDRGIIPIRAVGGREDAAVVAYCNELTVCVADATKRAAGWAVGLPTVSVGRRVEVGSVDADKLSASSRQICHCGQVHCRELPAARAKSGSGW